MQRGFRYREALAIKQVSVVQQQAENDSCVPKLSEFSLEVAQSRVEGMAAIYPAVIALTSLRNLLFDLLIMQA